MKNSDFVSFLKKQDYIMVNDNLGRGSFGKTVLLKDPFIGELFVAKKYTPQFENIKEVFFKNFKDEIRIMYKLNHKNIVRIYNYYIYQEACTGYILMEYIDGINIAQYMKEDRFLSDASLDDIFIQLIDGFSYMEENGIIHRDIREGNILVDKNGTVKIIDFGIGKIFGDVINNTDSLVKDINRTNSDVLPREFYEGIYTSQTDMFYIGELFNRLIKMVDKAENNFSYGTIIAKMMETEPKERFSSFSEIKVAVNKHDFINMEISREDKMIYQSFVNGICKIIIFFKSRPKFINDVETFIFRLENVIKNNLFEDVVQDNTDIIDCVVLETGYNFIPSKIIPCEVMKRFLKWFKEATVETQKIILNNIRIKLSTIEVKNELDDLPFS